MVLSRTRPDSSTISASNSPASSPRERSSVTFALPHSTPLSVTSTEGPVSSPSTRPMTTMGQVEVSVPLNSVPSSMRVFLVSLIVVSAFHLRDDLHAQPAAALERETGQLRALLHRRHQRPLALDSSSRGPTIPGLSRSKNCPWTVIEPPPAILQSASTPVSPTTSSVPSPRLIAQFSNRLSISTRAPASNSSVAFVQHVAVAEVAARRRRASPPALAQAGEQRRDLAVADAPGAVARLLVSSQATSTSAERRARADEARDLGAGELAAREVRARERRVARVHVAEVGARSGRRRRGPPWSAARRPAWPRASFAPARTALVEHRAREVALGQLRAAQVGVAEVGRRPP